MAGEQQAQLEQEWDDMRRCVCGHLTHNWVSGNGPCKAKRCKCRFFANEHRYKALEANIARDTKLRDRVWARMQEAVWPARGSR